MSILNTPLKKFFTEILILTPFTGDDDFNKPTYGATCQILAKIERQERATRTAEGLVIRSRRLIYLFSTDTSITTKDLIELPVGFEPLKPKLLDVRIVSNQNGVHHIILET